MNIGYDPNLNILLCHKCQDRMKIIDSGNLQCHNPECEYIYYMFSDIDNSFQIEMQY